MVLWLRSFTANGLISVIQRRLNPVVSEGVIYDLRSALFARLQRMSLRFFTNTKVGEFDKDLRVL